MMQGVSDYSEYYQMASTAGGGSSMMHNRKAPTAHMDEPTTTVTIAEEPPSAPAVDPGHCKICKYAINGEQSIVYSCTHCIHRVCAGRLRELGEHVVYLPWKCYQCKFKGKAVRLDYSQDDTIDNRTLSFKQWFNLIGMKQLWTNGHRRLTLTALQQMDNDMYTVLQYGIGFSNLMANLKEKPTFSDMVAFGMVKDVFKVKAYRHLIPLNRVLSHFRLTIDSLSGKYKEVFHFDVNDLPAMGADRTTLRILNLDAHQLAIHGATNETIKRLRISKADWVQNFGATEALLDLFNITTV